MAIDETSPTTPPTEGPEQTPGKPEPAKEPTVAEKLQETLKEQAFTFNKLNGITNAAMYIENAITVLKGEHCGFDDSSPIVIRLEEALKRLELYT